MALCSVQEYYPIIMKKKKDEMETTGEIIYNDT